MFLSDLVIKLTSVAEDYVNDYHKIILDEVTPAIFAGYLHTKKEIATPLKVITLELQRLNDDRNLRNAGDHMVGAWDATEAQLAATEWAHWTFQTMVDCVSTSR